jgi:hypothetical protein
MHLVGQLSNPPSRWTLNVLKAHPEGSPARPPIQGPKPRRLGNGSIRRAAMATLADGQVMKLAEIHVAVGKLLGRQVSYASVEWCLRMGVRGPAPWAVRIRPGWYRLN